MKPDVGFVRERFQAFNTLIFDSELPEIEIIISNSKSFLGRLEYKRRRRLLGREELFDFKMRVSARVDLPQSEVEDTIIHEMIHLYILIKGLKDSSTHGVVFRQKAAARSSLTRRSPWSSSKSEQTFLMKSPMCGRAGSRASLTQSIAVFIFAISEPPVIEHLRDEFLKIFALLPQGK